MTDFASGASGIASLAKAFDGSGGNSGGGTIVGGPTPDAANLAALYQSNAAKAAAEQAKQAVNSAISSINQNYQQARYDVQPYRTEGVQALNQLNQYLGLSAYNPGAAPNAPVKKTAQDYTDDITDSQIKNYINQNVSAVTARDPVGGGDFLHPQYTGVGSNDPELIKKYSADWGNVPYSGGVTSSASVKGSNVNPNDPGGSGIGSFATAFYNDPLIAQFAKQGIGEQLAQQDNANFQDKVDAYNTNLAEWQQNKNWYDQYTAEGTFTPDQVVQKISGQPGYQAELNQGQEAINRSAAARGYLGSGRILKELSQFGQNTLSKYYNNTLDRLQALANQGQAAATQSSNLAQQTGLNTGQLKAGLGDTLANSQLASGNAIAQGILAANQQYKVIGGSSGGGMK